MPKALTTGIDSLYQNENFQGFALRFSQRWREEPPFKYVIVGGTLYIIARVICPDFFKLNVMKKIWQFGMARFKLCKGFIIYLGTVESELPFGRLGYTRCMEADQEVLEKFNIPSNAEKCIRDGIQYIPGEFYQQFDLNEYDPKDTPLAWSYGPITDPSLIMPIGWYNDMSGENQEFELFCRYMRIIGYLPQYAYKELYQHCTIMLLQSNQRLINPGDPDDKIYIIIHGAVDIYSNRIGPLKEFVRIQTTLQGGQITSMFSMVDAIAGYARPVQSIYAVSKLNTTKVLVFPIAAIKDYLMRHPQLVVSALKRLLECAYKFQYQILHLAMHLTSAMSTMDAASQIDPSEFTEAPEPGEPITEDMRNDAIARFMEFLDIDDFEFLSENCRVIVVEAEAETTDRNILRESVLNQPCSTYKFVYSGKLVEFHLKSNLTPMEQQGRRKPREEEWVAETLIRIVPGQGVGGLTGILGYSDVLFFRCIERAVVVTLDRDSLNKLLERKPFAIFPIAYMTICRMSPLVRAMDFAMEWSLAKEGQYIYHKEQMCEDSFLILNGRARAYQLDCDPHERTILEYKENDWVGLSDSLLQSKRRSKTCVVIRDTEFIKIPNDLLRHIVINYASAAQVMLNFLVREGLKTQRFGNWNLHPNVRIRNAHRISRVNTIALIPTSDLLPYSVLALEIKRHYTCSGGSCAIVTLENTLAAVGKQDIEEIDSNIFDSYFIHQLQKHDLVIFMCVPRMHYWNIACSHHAEVMYSVGCSEIPNVSTVPQDFEMEILGKRISSRRKELILLHTTHISLPRNTKEWLFCRDWVHFHHHIRLPDLAFKLPGCIPEEELIVQYQDCLSGPICPSSDLSRFNRYISGQTFGVLFGSGGSRIGAQLGMLQALVEFKHIPIDMVCGTGAGFILAACYAIHQDYAKVQELIERFFRHFEKDLSKLKWYDMTFPFISFGDGKRILVYLFEMFGSVQLEDTWIPICVVTTNLTTQDVRVDRSGPIWVFARASLSHIAWSPPICDPTDGDYICDGAHANSLPQDIIKEYGADYIIAFNTVGGKFEGEIKADPNVSVFRYMKKTFAMFLKQIGVANPTINSIFYQLATTQTRMYAAGVEAIGRLEYAVFVRPPVEHLPSQSWSNLPILHRVGYFYMKAILDRNPYSRNIPFDDYWKQIRDTSLELAIESGRDLSSFKTNIN